MQLVFIGAGIMLNYEILLKNTQCQYIEMNPTKFNFIEWMSSM